MVSTVINVARYETTVLVSHYPDMTYSSMLSDVFRFKGGEMYIEIYGGTEKTHLAGSELVVDAKTSSRDTSYPPEEDAFTGNICKWTVTPEIENFTPTDNLVLTIPGESLKLGATYNFTISVTRTKIPRFKVTKTAYQLVEIVSGNVSEINIKCIRNCVNPHHLEPTGFAVECGKNCEYLNYKWSITPPVDPGRIDFGDGHDKFLVQENSYKAGDKITVTVKNGISHTWASLEFVTGIKKGECSIEPKEGISGVTVFKVRCSGFSSPYNVISYMIYEKSEDLEVMLNEDNYKEENDIYLSEGAPAVIKVKVQDNAYLQEETELSAQVKPFLPEEYKTVLEATKALVLSPETESITLYTLDGFRNKVVQMVSFLLNVIKQSKEINNSTVRDLQKHMGESLNRIELLRFATGIQLMSILTKLQKYKLKTDTLTSRLIGKSMVNAAFGVYNMHLTEGGFDIPQGYVNNFFEASLRLASELLKKVEEINVILNEPTPPHDYDSYDEYVSEKLKITDDLRDLVSSVIISIQANGMTTLLKNIPDQKESYFESELLHFATRRIPLTSLLNETIGISNVTKSKVFVPAPLLEELKEKHKFIDYQFGVFKRNPFWWSRTSSDFNTEFVLFDLFYNSYKIKKLKSPFYLHLQIVNIPVGKLRGALTEKNIAAHRIEIEPEFLLVAVFEASDDDYKVTWSECFCKEEDFSKGITIKKNTNDSERTLTARALRDAKIIYVCVMKSGLKLNYESNFATFSCLYWDIRTGKWKSDGCKVQKAQLQNNSLMVCECTHVSLFVGQIFVAPNSLSLEMDIDFAIAFAENKLMVIIVGGLLFLWLVFLVLAHLKDLAMKKKNVVYKLEDNVPGDYHAYLVVVFTGFFFDAETTADVGFQLIGDKAKSRVHLIKCQNVVMLKKNSQDWFIIHAPFYLGKLRKLRIWHNSKGNKPHWYCVRFIVQDLKSGEQYCFLVNKWLSLIWGDGKTYYEIRVEETRMKTRKVLFMTQAENEMRDKHLWMSILVRDTQSNFNGKERVSCAFCFVFLSMLANAMFFGVPRGVPKDSIDETTNFQLTFFHIVIFIESWLVATPVGMLIVLLFRNSAPRS